MPIHVLLDHFGGFEGEHELNVLLKPMEDAIVMVRPDGTITYWSKGAERIYGCTAEEVRGHPFSLLTPQENRAEMDYLLRQMREGHSVCFETMHLDQYQNLLPVTITAFPLCNAETKWTGALLIVKKASELHHDEIKQQYKTLENIAILEAMPQVLWIAEPDGRITYCNRKWSPTSDLPIEDVASFGQHLLHPEDIPSWLKQWQQALQSGHAFEAEVRLKDVSNVAYRWHRGYVQPLHDQTGTILRWIGTLIDIDDLRRAETQLQTLQQTAVERALILETVNHVALDILASRTGRQVLRHIAEAARTLIHARYAALGVVHPDGQELIEFATAGLTPEEEAAIGPRPKGKGVLGLLLHRTEPLRIDDLGKHPQSVGFPPNHPPMKSFLGVPILRENTVIGSLYLTEKEDGPFTESDEITVRVLGAYAAVAIHNLHLLSRQRMLVSRLIAAQEEERRTIAYELHDSLTQFIMAAHAHLEAFQHAQEKGKEERARFELDKSIRYLKEAVMESRRLVNGLRALALDDLGLVGALEQLLLEEKRRAGWTDAEFRQNIAGRRYTTDLETTIYRVAQEALTNARKHSHTDRVRLSLFQETDPVTNQRHLHLEIKDWGCGFTIDQNLENQGHLGLHSMSERVAMLGGTYNLQSAPGAGTTINATFPITEADEVKTDPA